MNVFGARLSSEGINAPGLVELLAGAKVSLNGTPESKLYFFTKYKVIFCKIFRTFVIWLNSPYELPREIWSLTVSGSKND